MTLLRRDPFARMEVHYESVPADGKDCSWCGQPQYRGGQPTGKLYKYRLETDGGTVRTFEGRFCCVRCARAYNGAV